MQKALQHFKHKKSYVINAIWSNANQGITAFFALLMSVAFARLATKELYGQYLFILSTISLFVIISMPGIGSVILRLVSQSYDGVFKKGTRFSFIWSLAGVPLIAGVGLYFYVYKDPNLGIGLLVGSLFFPFISSLQSWMAFLKAKSSFKRLAINNLIKSATQAIFVILAIFYSQNLLIILLANLAVSSLSNIFFFFNSLKLTVNNKILKGWKKQGYSLSIMDFSSLVFGQVDIILIGMLLPFSEVAIYGLVMKLVNVFLKGLKSTVEVILPKLFKSKKMNLAYFYKVFYITFFIPIIIYPFIQYPILWLYGTQYSDVIFYSQLYLFIIPIYFLNSVANNLLIKYELNKEINYTRIAAILLVVMLYFILIPSLGILGGVISSMAYFTILLAFNFYFVKTYEKTNLRNTPN